MFLWVPATFIGCTLGGAAGVVSYFEDTVVAMYNTSFDGGTNANTVVSVWVAKHSKLFVDNLRFLGYGEIGILSTDSQIKTVKYQGSDKDIRQVIIAAQDSNVSIESYNIFGTYSQGLISFVNSYATIENSVFTGIGMDYGSVIICKLLHARH